MPNIVQSETTQELSRTVGAEGQAPRLLILLLGAALLGEGIWLSTGYISHDVAWYFDVAGKMIDGQSLYQDVVMINPPMIAWLNVPIVWFDRLFLNAGVNILFFFFTGLAAVSLATIYLVACHYPETDGRQRSVLLIVAFLAVSVIPILDFGQREHLLIIFILPYLILVGVTWAGGRAPRILRAFVGAFACVGFVLKPHFFLVPLVLEILGLVRTRRLAANFRVETITLAVLALGYAVIVYSLYPQYLEVIIKYNFNVFHAYTQEYSYLLSVPEFFLLFFSAILILVFRSHLQYLFVFQSVFIASICFLAVFLLQKKGWTYQRLPIFATSAFCIFGCALLARAGRQFLSRAWKFAATLIAVVVLAIVVIRGPYSNVVYDYMKANVDGLSKGTRVYTFTSNVSHVFPLVNYEGLHWSSRFSTFWMIPGLAMERSRKGYGESPEVFSSLEEFTRDAIFSDLSKHAPDLIFVDVRRQKPYFKGLEFDYLDWLSEDPRFLELWESYEYRNSVLGYQIYERVK